MFVQFLNVQQSHVHEGALRHRADGQELPQRGHGRALHLPLLRVRADGDGVLRARRARARSTSSTGRKQRMAGGRASACPPRSCSFRQHDADELAHYSDGCFDVEYEFPWGWDELEGIASRTDYDLKAHTTGSRQEAALLRPGSDRSGDRARPAGATCRTWSSPRRARRAACSRCCCDAYAEGAGRRRRQGRAQRAQAAPAAGAVQGRRACRW